MKMSSLKIEYTPKASILINGEMVTFRLLEAKDESALREFFSQVSDREADTLRHDVRDPATVAFWIESLDYGRSLPLLAIREFTEEIAGISTLHFLRGVRAHIADIRIVVGTHFRKLGLGSAMIKELVEVGSRAGLYFLRAEILAENQLAVKAFRQLGFDSKCTLEDYFLTRKGDTRDVVLMLKRLRMDMEEDFFYVF